MAELVDALRSGRSERMLMWVRVPPSAFAKLDSVRGMSYATAFVVESAMPHSSYDEKDAVQA